MPEEEIKNWSASARVEAAANSVIILILFLLLIFRPEEVYLLEEE